MRTLRLSMVGLVVPILTLVLSTAVVAQEDAQEPSAVPYATHVTGAAVPTPEGNSYLMEGDGYVAEMDWSDPRLPSRMLFRANAEAAPGTEADGSGGAVRIGWTVRLEGLEGSWSGSGHSLAWMSSPPGSGVESEDARTEVSLLLLDGEGIYTGLSAWLTGPSEGSAADYQGFIFESPLTMPDPIEPTSGQTDGATADDATDAAAATTITSEDPLSRWPDGQRVVMPEADLAVSLPRDWLVEMATEGSDLPILVLAQPDRFGPRVELQPLLVARSPSMSDRSEANICSLVRYAPIDITADEFLHEVFGESDALVVESLHEGLSRVLVNSWIQSRILTDTPEAIYIDHYAIGIDDALGVLMCSGAASHRGDWLSIAESVESLSAGE